MAKKRRKARAAAAAAAAEEEEEEDPGAWTSAAASTGRTTPVSADPAEHDRAGGDLGRDGSTDAAAAGSLLLLRSSGGGEPAGAPADPPATPQRSPGSRCHLRVLTSHNNRHGQAPPATPASPRPLSAKRERNRTGSWSSAKHAPKTELLVDQPTGAKWKNFILRSVGTLLMIAGFFLVLACGPLGVIALIVGIQTGVYKELIYLAHVPSKEKKLPWSRSLNWYFLLSTNYFLYGESIIHYFKSSVLVDAILLPLATYHRFISFVLYCIGFVLFVANLKKGHYKFQFQQFAWTHMTLLLVVFTSHSIINNIFEGLFWVFLPVSLVICNDIFAYVCGFFWGRTPLIKLSPKKTWEGFVGAWMCTILFGLLWTAIFSRSPFMICPVKDLTVTVLSDIHCEPNPVFVSRRYELWPAVAGVVRRVFMTNVRQVNIAPIYFHTMILSCFASLIAPFGGFFASGFKRAFKIKDFADIIPGHGGLTDRMDCQFLMGLFSALYHSTFIRTVSAVTVAQVLETAVAGLEGGELLELYRRLQRYLLEQGLLEWNALGGLPEDAGEWAQ